jgi:hypothetical protein
MMKLLKVITFVFLFSPSTLLLAADHRSETNKELLILKLENTLKKVGRYSEALSALEAILKDSKIIKEQVGIDKYSNYLTEVTERTFRLARCSDDLIEAYRCVEHHLYDENTPGYKKLVFSLFDESDKGMRHFNDDIKTLNFTIKNCGQNNADEDSHSG